METYGGVEVELHAFLTLSLNEDQLRAPGVLLLEKTLKAHWIRDLTGSEPLSKRKILALSQNVSPTIQQAKDVWKRCVIQTGGTVTYLRLFEGILSTHW
jgi:hypothetical protein